MLKLQKNISLAEHTSFGIGGPASYFAEVENVEDLKEVIKIAKGKNLDFLLLGGGSNVLVSDVGFSGLAIKVKFENIESLVNENLKVGAGTLLSKMVNFSKDYSLTGLEWAAGIPGTVGGAIVGNAGTLNGEMKNLVKKVNFFDIEKFNLFSLDGEKCDFTYRSSYFKGNNNLIILDAELFLENGDAEEIKSKVEKTIQSRAGKQPSGKSAGSFFVNPIVEDESLRADFEKENGVRCVDNKIPAGWFIEKIDFKGKKIGGAQVSDKHANFILNTGDAKAEDFIILASLIKQKVREKYEVQLKEEVQYIGF